jgi:hypothetical protein
LYQGIVQLSEWGRVKLLEFSQEVAANIADLKLSLSRRSFLGAGAAGLGLAGMGSRSTRAAIAGRNFYVSNGGNDSNPGTADKPFLTIGGVFSRITNLGARDRINVMPGTYNEAVTVNAGGSPKGNLTLASTVPYGAKLVSPSGSYSAITINKSYVTVDGFDVQSGGTGHAIEATYLDGNPANNGPHHLSIVNNVCHDSPGSGISVSYGDYYTIENNDCYRNCSTNPYQGSGISVYAPRAASGAQTTRIFVLRNTCFSNTALTLPRTSTATASSLTTSAAPSNPTRQGPIATVHWWRITSAILTAARACTYTVAIM